MPAGVIIFLCIIAAVWLTVIVVAVRGFRHARRMAKEFPAYAARRGWEYRRWDKELPGEFSGFPFDEYGKKEASKVLIGTHDGRPCTAFELTIWDSGSSSAMSIGSGTGSSGDGSDISSFGVVALRMASAAPALEVKPAGHLHRVWNKLNGRDIKTGDEAFDHDFSVHCESPDFARALMDPGTIALVREHPKLSWRFDRDSMLVIRQPKPFAVSEVDEILTFMDAILDRLPAYQPRPEQG